jgi:hypothetical protein
MGLICSGGKVKHLYESLERCVVGLGLRLRNAGLQGIFGPPFDWVDSDDDWTIDGTQSVVRVGVDHSESELTLLASHAGVFPATS